MTGGSVRYGLSGIKGVGTAAAQHIHETVQKGGPFKSLADFAGRIDTKIVGKKALEALAAAGAFDALHPCRATVFANITNLIEVSRKAASDKENGVGSIWG